MDLRDSRELALQRLSRFCRSGFVSVTDFRHDPLRIFAAHECAAMVDPSMATKMTVSLSHLEFLCMIVGGGRERSAAQEQIGEAICLQCAACQLHVLCSDSFLL